MKLSNQAYDVLKWVALVVIPALGAFYFGLAGLWGLPYADQVAGTMVLIESFLGALLGVSTMRYNSDQKSQ